MDCPWSVYDGRFPVPHESCEVFSEIGVVFSVEVNQLWRFNSLFSQVRAVDHIGGFLCHPLSEPDHDVLICFPRKILRDLYQLQKIIHLLDDLSDLLGFTFRLLVLQDVFAFRGRFDELAENTTVEFSSFSDHLLICIEASQHVLKQWLVVFGRVVHHDSWDHIGGVHHRLFFKPIYQDRFSFSLSECELLDLSDDLITKTNRHISAIVFHQVEIRYLVDVELLGVIHQVFDDDVLGSKTGRSISFTMRSRSVPGLAIGSPNLAAVSRASAFTIQLDQLEEEGRARHESTVDSVGHH